MGDARGYSGKHLAGKLLVAIAGILLAAACAENRIDHHRLLRLNGGDSLWRIAKQNRVSLDALVKANVRLDPARLRPGSVIYVPVRTGWSHAASLNPLAGKREADVFIWPVNGRIGSRFGYRGSRRHAGIDLKASRGADVRAAESGQVIWSGRMRGYGRMIKIKHSSRFVTLYAHNDMNLVRTGARVFRGQVVARVGQSGNATGPHLHFEVIRNGRARDPLYYLPVEKPAVALARGPDSDPKDPPQKYVCPTRWHGVNRPGGVWLVRRVEVTDPGDC